MKPCANLQARTFCSSLGSTLLFIESTTIDPLYLWVIKGAWRGRTCPSFKDTCPIYKRRGAPTFSIHKLDLEFWGVLSQDLLSLYPMCWDLLLIQSPGWGSFAGLNLGYVCDLSEGSHIDPSLAGPIRLDTGIRRYPHRLALSWGSSSGYTDIYIDTSFRYSALVW